MATVLLTGGTGMIGSYLQELLTAKGYTVIVLVRDKVPETSPSNKNISYAKWNVEQGLIDPDAIAAADHIIHLAGAGVADKRWSKKRKQEILESRTQSGALLVKALKEIPNKVKTVVSASAIGWYGPDTNTSKQKGFAETRPNATDFLGTTCKQWEESIKPVEALNKRLVIYRFGIVLSNSGGALAEFKKPLKAGIATILGNGRQTISWIHIDDLCRLLLFAIEQENISGVYNAVAPKPVSNKELVLTLAKLLRNDFYIPVYVPSFALQLKMGEMSIEVLKSATVSAEKISGAGFTFLYPSIEAALGQLTNQNR